MKKTPLLFVLALILFAGCKKSGHDDGGCERSITTMVGSYSLIRFESKVLGNYVDITSIAVPDTCQYDDKITLNADGSAYYTDLGLQCSSPQSVTDGSWAVHNNKIDIHVGRYDIIGADVDYFNCNKLVLIYNYTTTTTSGSNTSTVRLTMTK